jgi:hypothetical protein
VVPKWIGALGVRTGDDQRVVELLGAVPSGRPGGSGFA